jgi:predicted membrane protein (TIGR00267 family)
LRALRELLAREDVRALSRRYFISNGFDGALTSVGVVVGSYLSGVADGVTVFKIGIGAAVGLGTSGVWSVWEIERAEKRAELLQLERAMLANLGETEIARRKAEARRINAVMSGLGPVVGILVPLTPALLEGTYLSLRETTFAGVMLGVALLFLFGAYLGRLSKQNWVVAGIRMGVAGLFVAGLNLVLPG